jgi:hypothetical protein
MGAWGRGTGADSHCFPGGVAAGGCPPLNEPFLTPPAAAPRAAHQPSAK